MAIIEGFRSLLSGLLWTANPVTQASIALIIVVATALAITVYFPLIGRLRELARLRAELLDVCRKRESDDEAREQMREAFASSALAEAWLEFERRWSGSRRKADSDRAPVRFADVLAGRPLASPGLSRSLLPSLPGLILAAGVLATFMGLSQLTSSDVTDPVATLGGALRASLWGVMLAFLTTLSNRWLTAQYETCADDLDKEVAHLYPSLSAAEVASMAASAEAAGLQHLASELSDFSSDLGRRIDKGLKRIERSTAASASLVSEEQRDGVGRVVGELSATIQAGVESHLGTLSEALHVAVEHQGSVTGGLALCFERMSQQAESHVRVTETLDQAAAAVAAAAESMSGSTDRLEPLLEGLNRTGAALEATSAQVAETQQAASNTLETVRATLEGASGSVREQGEVAELHLSEIQRTLEGLSATLGDKLAQSLRSVDDALSQTVGRLRETILESNETIDRLAVPVRAAEGTTAEMRNSLDQIRGDVGSMSEWLIQAVKPIRSALAQLDDRTGSVTRALLDFGDRASAMEKTVDAMRAGISEEGRELRAATRVLGAQLTEAANALAASTARSAGPVAVDPMTTLVAAHPTVEGDDVASKALQGPPPVQKDPSASPQTPGRALGPDPWARSDPGPAPTPHPATPPVVDAPADDGGTSGLSGLLQRGSAAAEAAANDHGECAAPGQDADDKGYGLRRLFRKE